VVMSWLYVRAFGVPRGKLDLEVWRILTKEAPTFTSIAIFSTIHLSIAQIMLSKLQSMEAVGIFSAADRLLAICKTIPVAFSSALLPFFAKQFASGTEELKKLSTDSLRYLFVGIFPVVVGTFILADSIITLIYGQKFASAGQVLRFHILSLIPFAVDYIQAQVLIATDNQKVDLKINIAAAITNTILSYLLIFHVGVMGAVIAPLSTIIIVNSLQYMYIRRNLFRVPFTDILTRVLVASLVMGMFTYVLRDHNIFLNVAVSAVVYGLLVVLLRVVSHEEFRFLEGFMVRKSGKADG
jgi:O-antigen/teichoic acid export membrane protein